ncbi:MAG: hypothetical protein KBF32_09345 [Chitinophagales bacterium]|nr:hypothetical protein [Chitinophagales bacterium]
MGKEIALILLLLAIFSLFISCERDQYLNHTQNSNHLPVILKEDIVEQDNFKVKFAQVLAYGLASNEELRKFIKAQAKLKVDGDYDIPVGLLLGVDINGTSFEEIIAENAIAHSILFSELGTESAEIDTIIAKILKFSDLNIAVPIHINKWQTKKFIPITAVLTTENNGENSNVIQGFNSNGEVIWLDSKTDPVDPVVVVGNNERGYVLNGEFIRFAKDSNENVFASECPPYPLQFRDHDLTRSWQFEAFRFDDLRAVEDWAAGAPEINIYVAQPCNAQISYYESVEPPKDEDIMGKWWYHQLHIVDFLNDNETSPGGFTKEMEVIIKFLEVDGNITIDELATYEFVYYGTKTITIPRDGNGNSLGHYFLTKDKFGNQQFEFVPSSSAAGFQVMISGVPIQ